MANRGLSEENLYLLRRERGHNPRFRAINNASVRSEPPFGFLGRIIGFQRIPIADGRREWPGQNSPGDPRSGIAGAAKRFLKGMGYHFNAFNLVKYSRVVWKMTGLSTRSAMRLGTIISPFIMSEKVQTKSSFTTAPMKMTTT